MSEAIAAAVNPLYAGMPARYHVPWKQPFNARIDASLRPGIRILDVGSGRTPAISRDRLPPGAFYVGLDLSASELRTAPTGSYDEMRVSDINTRVPELEGQFDLAVSWQVLEHVKSLDDSFANIRAYLKPGGRMITQFSGTFSIFGMINQVIPSSVVPWALKTLTRRNPETVFPAYYHHCWASAIERALTDWSDVEILDRYQAAGYWRFAKPLQHLYLRYENWAQDSGRSNLATHYLVDARRPQGAL